MGGNLRTKCQVSSVILTGFRQGVILTPSPISKRTPKEPTQIMVKRGSSNPLNVKIKSILVFKICKFISLEYFELQIEVSWLA